MTALLRECVGDADALAAAALCARSQSPRAATDLTTPSSDDEDMSADLALRVEVSAGGMGRLVAIGPDGLDRVVAQLVLPPVDLEYAAIALARSPSGTRAAVRAEATVWTFDLTTGDVVGRHATSPGASEEGILIWGADDVARLWVAADGVLDVMLAPETRVSILGPVEEDGGEAVSGSGGGFLYFESGTSAAAKDEALERARAHAAAAAVADVHLRIAVTVGDRETVVHDLRATHSAGLARVQWPPLAGSRGVLLRHVQVRSQPPQAGTRQIGSQEYEVQHPWLITPDGELRTLPFELGNRPLTTMPDGRFLLPCYRAMWWDGSNEGMSVVDDEGHEELLHRDGVHVTPMGTVRAVDPSLVPAEDPDDYDSDDAWSFAAARVTTDTLTVALERGRGGAVAGGPWMLVTIPLDGVTCGAPRRIAGGTPAVDALVRVII